MWTGDVLWRDRPLLGGAMLICDWCFVFIYFARLGGGYRNLQRLRGMFGHLPMSRTDW